MRTGVILITISMAITPLGDGLSKALGETQSPIFICFLRYFIAGILAVIIARILGKQIHVPTHHRTGMVFRTGLVMGAMTLLVAALSMVPLAEAVGGFLIAPVVATLISVFVLKERMTKAKLIGSLVAFAGALAILKPSSGLETGTLMALAGGGLLGWYLAATRGAAQSSGAISSLAVQCLLGSAMLAPFAFWGGVSFEANLIPAGVGLGVITASCHFLTVAAYERAEASVLSPFLYFNLIAAVAVGYFWFDELPSLASVFGLFAVASGGLITLISPKNLEKHRPFATGQIRLSAAGSAGKSGSFSSTKP